MIKTSRNEQIEGLRGLSILFVCFYHLFYRYNDIFIGGSGSISLMGNWGGIGVTLFMMITCWYLIDFEKDQKDFSISKYAVNRFIRLWPCYAIAITIITAVAYIAPIPYRTRSWKVWLLSLTFLNGYTVKAYVDGAHWYLTTLISLMAVTALLKKFNIEKNPLPYLLLNIFTWYSTLHPVPILPMLIGGGYVITLGIMVGIKFFMTRSKLASSSWITKISWGGVLATGIMINGGVVSITFFLCLLLFLACVLGKLPFMGKGILRFLGEISYPFYLIHQNLSYEIEYYLTQYFGTFQLWYGILAFFTMILLAYILHKVEIRVTGKLRTYADRYWNGLQ